MYETAGELDNKIRLRLHIGLKSSVDDLQNDVIRILDTTLEVSDLYFFFLVSVMKCTNLLYIFTKMQTKRDLVKLLVPI